MKPSPWVRPPKRPVLLTVPPNTSPIEAWWLPFCRKNHRMMTITAAPITCHHTEMLLSTASRWLEKMLTTAASARMIANSMKTRVSE